VAYLEQVSVEWAREATVGSLFPVHPEDALWALTHRTEHVRRWHRGHLYRAACARTARRGRRQGWGSRRLTQRQTQLLCR